MAQITFGRFAYIISQGNYTSIQAVGKLEIDTRDAHRKGNNRHLNYLYGRSAISVVSIYR